MPPASPSSSAPGPALPASPRPPAGWWLMPRTWCAPRNTSPAHRPCLRPAQGDGGKGLANNSGKQAHALTTKEWWYCWVGWGGWARGDGEQQAQRTRQGSSRWRGGRYWSCCSSAAHQQALGRPCNHSGVHQHQGGVRPARARGGSAPVLDCQALRPYCMQREVHAYLSTASPFLPALHPATAPLCPLSQRGISRQRPPALSLTCRRCSG